MAETGDSMANEQNLRPAQYKLSQEEAKRGGIASGKARREKKMLKDALSVGLSIALQGDSKDELEDLDFADALNNPNLSMLDKIAVAMIAEAANGNVQAAAFIRDTMGEKPAEKIDVSADIETAKKSVAEIVRQVSSE